MPINLAGGYAAGGVKDALLDIVKQRMLEQELAQREEENRFQRLRAQKLDARADEQTQYQRGRDLLGDARLKDEDRLKAEALQRTLGEAKLRLQEGQPGTDLVPQDKWKMQPTSGLPPSLGGREPQLLLWRGDQADVPPVEIPGVGARRPRTKEEIDAEKTKLLDEASQRQINENLASRAPQRIAVGTFEDYVLRKFGQSPTPEQVVQARKEYGQADDAAHMAPVLKIQTVDANGNPITRVLTREEAAGQDFAAGPTTDQRNRAAAVGRSATVLQSINELSERINTGQGVIAKVQGAAARAAAQANLDDDVSEYQALVQMFTPLLARAVGHTGVLTEQDVASVRSGLPQPGDSKSVRDRKMARIDKIMGGTGGIDTGQGQKAATTGFPAAGTERTVGGKVYVSDGAKFVPKGGG